MMGEQQVIFALNQIMGDTPLKLTLVCLVYSSRRKS
jgi:hypothetical protein